MLTAWPLTHPGPSFPSEVLNAANPTHPSLGSGEGHHLWKALQRESQGLDKRIPVGEGLPGHVTTSGDAGHPGQPNCFPMSCWNNAGSQKATRT